jgi:hypothetical protein
MSKAEKRTDTVRMYVRMCESCQVRFLIILCRKEVQLLSRVSHKHFNHYETRQAFEWNAMVSAVNALLDGPVVAFSFGYILLIPDIRDSPK